MKTVGQIKTGEEFKLNGRIFKRIGPYLFGFDSPIRESLYRVTHLPDARTGEMVESHQNCIMVQEKEKGGFYFAECYEQCDVDEQIDEFLNWLVDRIQKEIEFLPGDINIMQKIKAVFPFLDDDNIEEEETEESKIELWLRFLGSDRLLFSIGDPS
jgi:hypothetical protein